MEGLQLIAAPRRSHAFEETAPIIAIIAAVDALQGVHDGGNGGRAALLTRRGATVTRGQANPFLFLSVGAQSCGVGSELIPCFGGIAWTDQRPLCLRRGAVNHVGQVLRVSGDVGVEEALAAVDGNVTGVIDDRLAGGAHQGEDAQVLVGDRKASVTLDLGDFVVQVRAHVHR